MHFFKYLSLLVITLQLFACNTTPSRYSQKHDSIPTRLPQAHELEEPEPKIETPSRGGNKNYQVFGQPYQVLPTASGYVEEGTASWYGNKFHGHLTSNGETYDMYAFSAAHKSLPIPTYAKVTNLANNKSVIVRVNDRGPFHEDRLIDLSYSAAYKLDYLKQGTAKVRIEAITAENIAQYKKVKTQDSNIALNNKTSPTPNSTTKVSSANRFIHVLVTRDKLLADNTAKGLKFLMSVPVNLSEKNELFRVQIGPIDSAEEAKLLLANIQKQGYPEAYPLNSLK
ncbi:septal ring lytic transglycosylase RlpA family protein [Thalassomonas sp. M1454]|uniref:septal ring lytic transglycosylase RlpA family protein n=1 Tax=Thalassomonas sp. M1454 TaxID=2594477 RepID=UPI0011806B62|nr:septal ring lytic transglycosylase RlpA family protein [Thalassomonas sp. M1454]TRX57367.1 septal ring lytic transglycosylase RlpA family protein [Thalassomonas sp. M1454]